MLRYLGHSAASGVIGWIVLMAMFEGAYWADAYRQKWQREHKA